MAKVTIFGILSNLQILLKTLISGKAVGTDQYGNRYYKAQGKGRWGERRWVIYKGVAEASTVPAEWHGWLHHQTDIVPAAENRLRKPWQKHHLSNQTGTPNAYLPPGHAARGGQRPHATGDYVAWEPPQS